MSTKQIGKWRRLAQAWRCARQNCDDRMPSGTRVLILGDGRTYCKTHGEELQAETAVPQEADLMPEQVKRVTRRSKRTDKTIPA